MEVMYNMAFALYFMEKCIWRLEQDRKVLFLYAKFKNRGT